mgnify:CR=1 FL=1|jgi:hypothetical protein|tara:strand:- start:10859 stop:11185 length:327 start_codon:yes stop_codon:yes gene_type:complete
MNTYDKTLLASAVEYVKLAAANIFVWAANASAWSLTDSVLKTIAALIGIAVALYTLHFIKVRVKYFKEKGEREKREHEIDMKLKELELNKTAAVTLKRVTKTIPTKNK